MTGHDLREATWRVLDQRTLVDRRPWYRIDEQRVELPDGRVIDGYAQMRLRDYAIVVALTEDDHLLVERMYKHGPGRVVLDLVAGLVEDSERPADAAKRELREETGYESERWTSLGSYVVNSNYGCGRMHAFLATDAKQTLRPDSPDLEEMELMLLPFREAVDRLLQGKVELLSAAAAIALANAHRTRPAA